MELYAIKEVLGLYVDAAAGNQRNELCFLSVWGLDTAIQELLGRLSLPWREGGLVELKLKSLECLQDVRKSFAVGNAAYLQKHTARASSKESLFQGLVHLWLYHPCVTQIDYANHRCMLLKQQTEETEIFSKRLWEAVKTVCPVPLLDTWTTILKDFERKGWMMTHTGIQVDVVELDFSCEEVEPCISDWIKQGRFKLPSYPEKNIRLALVK